MATLLEDNFDRADNASVVGSPQIGPAPVIQTGTAGILTNRLSPGTIPLNITYNLGTPNVELSFLHANGGSAYVCVLLGYASATDYYYVAYVSGAATQLIHNRIGGAVTLQQSSVKFPLVGTSVLKAHHRDGIIRAYVDGVLVIRYVLDAPITANLHGIRISTSPTGRIDNLLGVDAPTISEPVLSGKAPLTGDIAVSNPPYTPPSFAYLGRDTKLQDIAEGA